MGIRTIDKSALVIARSRAAAIMAVHAGAMVLEVAAKGYCPVRTGTLRRSIHTEMDESRADVIAARIGPDAPYGPYVEFGTRRQRAQPYMRPAVDQDGETAKRAAMDSFARSMKGGI